MSNQILITPTPSSGNPSIGFSGSTSGNITLYVVSNGNLNFSGQVNNDLFILSDNQSSAWVNGLTSPSISATTISGGTIFSAGTNIQSLFASSTNITNLQTDINNKVNRSGDTMTGQLNASVLTASTATTIYLKVNTASASTTNPERVFIYDGVVNGYSNVLVGVSSASTYAQLNIKNISAASGASSDIVATANNGDENTNYVDLGINSSAFAGFVGTANDAYLYSAGNNLLIGNTTQNKNVGIFVGSSTATTADFSSGKTTFNKPIYSGNSEISTLFPYDVSSFRVSGSTFDRWYGNNITGFAFSTASLTNARLTLIPFVITKQITIDRFAIAVSTGTGVGGDVARLGIYNSSVTNSYFPTTLLSDFGTVPVSAISTNLSITVNQVLTPGLYYGAIIANSGPTLRAVPSTALPNYFGSTNNLSTAIGTYLTVNSVFGSLPSDITISASTITIIATVCPYIAYRVSIN